MRHINIVIMITIKSSAYVKNAPEFVIHQKVEDRHICTQHQLESLKKNEIHNILQHYSHMSTKYV